MMKNHLRIVLAALFLLAGSVVAFAQQKISGTIVDLSGQPVIGASVMIPGTTTGAVTNLDGKYELSVPTGSNLTVSCIGYVDQSFTVVAGKNVYDFKLSDDAEMLEETIVIGYGTVKVKDLTGSVAAVGSKDLEIPVSNVGQALQGKMAGVVVSMGSQSPGASPTIRVRGNKSINTSNEPLVLVDGFPGSLSNVPADQIKSINVLKDAASTAIYGSRGAAGVILVTTKNAIEGQTSVSYSGYVQIKDSSTEIYDVLNAEDYLKFTLGYARDYNAVNYENMLKYFGIGANYGNKFSSYAGRESHNWQRDLLKTGISHNHNLTISTGTQRARTLFSMNYTYDDGTVINSWYRRINANLRTTQKITNTLDFELNLAYNTSMSQGNSRQGSAYQYRALEPLGPEPTNYSGFGNGSGSYIDPASDPIELTYNSEPGSSNHNFRGMASLSWRPVKGLTLRSEMGLNKGFTRSESYVKGYGNTEKSAGLSRGESSRLNWNTTAQYEIPFKNKNHRADIMVGNELRMTDGQSMSFNGYDYPDNFDRARTFAFMNQYIRDFNFSTSYNTPGRSVSFFSRANYAFKDRYLLTLTFRADGSANFAPNNRWGYFPAAAFAWRISDEPWMAGTRDWLSSLKFRLSYGVTGSDSIGANHWRETWSLGGNTSYTISNQRYDTELDYARPYAPGSQMQNPNLRWESTYTTNVGFDFGLFNNRLEGTIEGYQMITDGLLMSTPVNAASGYGSQYQNLGTISNRGIELSLNATLVRNADFTLRAGLVFQYNRNQVDYIAPSVTSTKYGSWSNSEHRPSGGEYFIEEGSPMGMIKAYAYDGWYTTDDFNFDPTTGVYTLKEGIPDWAEDSYWTSFNLPKGQAAFPGALKLKDLAGGPNGEPDGRITTDDTYVFGEMTPPASGSFNLQARWRQFDMTANFNYVLGGHIMNVPALTQLYGSKDNRFGANRFEFVKDCYSPYRWNNGELEFVNDPSELAKMNANAKYWSPTSMVGMLVDKYLEDASFLRLKNLSIGYTIPTSVLQKVRMKSARVYFTATNLFTLTKYTGLNPEVSISSSTTPGVDNGSYPISRTYTFGVNLTF